MKLRSILALLGIGLVLGCSSKQKIKEIDTELKDKQSLGGEQIGKKDGSYVVQKKENLVSYLMNLQREVYELEEGIYGNKAYGNKGKYGVLEDCRIELRAKSKGKWEMVEPAPKTILSKEEAKITKHVGIDEKGELVVLSEEELTNRIKRFERYKRNYEQQDDWYDTEIKACKVALNNFVNHKFEKVPPPPPAFPDFAKEQQSDRDVFICQYVDANASLKKILEEAVGNGWLLEEDLAGRPYVNNESAKDPTGYRHSYVLKIDGWVLAYDYRMNYGELMNEDKDAELKAWHHRDPDSLKNSGSCLPNGKRWSTMRK